MSHMSLHKAIFWPILEARAAKYHEQWFPSPASHISRRMCHETQSMKEVIIMLQ